MESRVNQKKWFSQEELSSIISDVYQGLQYLREMGVCHRDIKAANIFMSEGRAKIADFGLAKFYKYIFHNLDKDSKTWISAHLSTCRLKESSITHTEKKLMFGRSESLYTN